MSKRGSFAVPQPRGGPTLQQHDLRAVGDGARSAFLRREGHQQQHRQRRAPQEPQPRLPERRQFARVAAVQPGGSQHQRQKAQQPQRPAFAAEFQRRSQEVLTHSQLVLARLTLSVIDTSESRFIKPTAIKFGPIGVRGESREIQEALEHGPETYVEFSGSLLPGWAISMFALALLARGHPDRLDRLDLVRLRNRACHGFSSAPEGSNAPNRRSVSPVNCDVQRPSNGGRRRRFSARLIGFLIAPLLVPNGLRRRDGGRDP